MGNAYRHICSLAKFFQPPTPTSLSSDLSVCFRHYYFLKILFIYLLERGRAGETEGEKHQRMVASYAPPTGDLACNPGMCPRQGIEPETLWFTGQHSTTELHLPGLMETFLNGSKHSFSLRTWFQNLLNNKLSAVIISISNKIKHEIYEPYLL